MNNIDEIINEFNSFHNENEEIFRKKKWLRKCGGSDNENLILVINTEYFPSDENEITHIHHDCNYWGSNRFNEWLEKYKLSMEWWDECIVYIYYEKDA
jgi:hypothetical protein